jgi:hypothetical protein
MIPDAKCKPWHLFFFSRLQFPAKATVQIDFNRLSFVENPRLHAPQKRLPFDAPLLGTIDGGKL